MRAFLFVLLILLAFGLAANGNAASIPGLATYVSDTVHGLESAMADRPEVNTALDPDADRWFFKSFLLRVRPQGGFEVPHIAKLQIIIETEFVFTRGNPDGWTNYKP